MGGGWEDVSALSERSGAGVADSDARDVASPDGRLRQMYFEHFELREGRRGEKQGEAGETHLRSFVPRGARTPACGISRRGTRMACHRPGVHP